MTKTNRLLLWAGLLLVGNAVSGVEPGGRLAVADLAPKAAYVTGTRSVTTVPSVYEVMMFFDASEANAPAYLRMLDEVALRYAEFTGSEPVAFFALSRNSKRLTLENSGGVLHFPVHADEKQVLFREYAADDLLLPFALIAKGGKVIWKGSPTDVETVLNLIRNGKFEPSRQLKIERLRKEMQSAIQSSLPDVIERCADQILLLQPGDMIAVQAKLFVFESTGRFRQALDFIREVSDANPGEINLRILYLDFLVRAGDEAGFRAAFDAGVPRFASSTESQFRLLAFAVERAPFGWLPPKTARDVSERVLTAWKNYAPDRRAMAYELDARVRHFLTDIVGAVEAQETAVKLRAGTPAEKTAQARLDYFKSIRDLKQK